MDVLIAAAGVLTAGAITPGPNNLIVMHEAAHGGWRAALSVGIGIVAGGLALLMSVVAGAGLLVQATPGSIRLLSVLASLLLVAFGMRSIRDSFRADRRQPVAGTVRRLGGVAELFFFQFLNPKAWILAVAVVSSTASGTDPAMVLPQLTVLFVVIPAACLALWSMLGLLVMRRLERPRVRAWFDRLAGGLFVGFALLLLLGGFDVG